MKLSGGSAGGSLAHNVGEVFDHHGHLFQGAARGRGGERPGGPIPCAHQAVVHLKHLSFQRRFFFAGLRGVLQQISDEVVIAFQG